MSVTTLAEKTFDTAFALNSHLAGKPALTTFYNFKSYLKHLNVKKIYHKADNTVHLAVIRTIISAIHVRTKNQEKLRMTFLRTIESSGLSSEERSILLRELSSPTHPRGIAKLVKNRETGRLLLAISLVLLGSTHRNEKDYLKTFIDCLDIDILDKNQNQKGHITISNEANDSHSQALPLLA